MSTRAVIVFAMALMLTAVALVAASGESDGPSVASVIVTLDAPDIAFANTLRPPAAGWMPGGHAGLDARPMARAHGIDPPAVWVRFRFDASQGDGAPLAILLDYMRERFTVFYNGVDITRTNGAPDDESFGWHRPIYDTLPIGLLRRGSNELVIHIESSASRPLSIGTVKLGGDVAIGRAFNRQLLFNITGPQIINGVLATLTLASLLFWFVRPREEVFGWLALVGVVWFFRNLHYFIRAPPFDNDLFWILTTDSIFVLLALVYGFAATFFDLAGKRRLIGTVAAVCGLGIALRHGLLAAGQGDLPSFLVTIPVAAATLFILSRAVWRQPRTENILMLFAVAAATAFGFHDLLLVAQGNSIIAIYLQPYGSLLVFAAFGFALGRRMLVALATNEDVNMTLERRMVQATASLERSEAQRRELLVANAVEGERERMMREIHDGIGSSLITALAVAERQDDSPGTIATLKRSITDLRIGVDSLEPIDGDVTTLLANLRHRMERELYDAGVAFVWKVEATPALPWLDAVGALHVLRILQETIGNILAHAQARLIDVVCVSSSRDGRPGIAIGISDDGCGFDPGTVARGRGLSNMRARAEALSAEFTCETGAGSGTRISLWLPLERRAESLRR